MSTSGGGFAASGLLQGFAQAYTQARVRATQMEVEQRHGLASTLMQLYPNARPEAQADIAQRLLSIYSTPPGKKLDKKIGDIGSLGQAAAQQGMQQGAQAGAANAQAQTAATQGQMNAQPAPTSGVGLPAPPGVGAAPDINAASPQGAVPISKPGIPPPPAYSPLLSPQEKVQQAAQMTSAQTEATVAGQIKARDAYLEAHPDADPAEVAMALGHTLPMWAMQTKVINKGVLGSDLLRSDPNLRTMSGQPLDPNSRYDLGSTGFNKFAMPTGISTDLATSTMGKNVAQVHELNTRSELENARRSLIPLQAQKIAQDMLLNPQKVEIARANAVGRWFGPTAPSRQSAQYAGDVEDKIDDVEPLIQKLGPKVSALQGRWEQIWTDRVRAGDADFANLGTQMDVLAKAVMKMHGFRNAEDAHRFIAERLNEATDSDQLFGSLEGLRTAAQSYERMADFPPEIQAQMEKAFSGGRPLSQANVKPPKTKLQKQSIPTPPGTPPAAGGGAAPGDAHNPMGI